MEKRERERERERERGSPERKRERTEKLLFSALSSPRGREERDECFFFFSHPPRMRNLLHAHVPRVRVFFTEKRGRRRRKNRMEKALCGTEKKRE